MQITFMPRLITLLWLGCLVVGCSWSPPPLPTPAPVTLRMLHRANQIDSELFAELTLETGTTIDYHTYSSSDEAYNILTASRQTYDLAIISDVLIDRLRGEQRLAALQQERLPNLVNLDPIFTKASSDSTMRFCVPYLWSILGFGYRRSAHNQPIISWDAVFNPEHTHRVVLFDDARYSLGLALIKLGYSPNSSDPVAISAARDWLRERAKQISHFATDDGPALLARGEADIVIGRSSAILQLASVDPDIRFAIPIEGSIIAVDSLCIPIDTSNQPAAEQVINAILDTERSMKLANTTRYGTPNRVASRLLDADLQRLTQQYQDLVQEGKIFRVVDVDHATRERYRAAWAEVRR